MRDEAAGVSYNALVKAGLVAEDDDDFDINECEGMDEASWRGQGMHTGRGMEQRCAIGCCCASPV